MDSSKRGRAGRKTFNREDEAEMKEQGQKGFPTDAEQKGSDQREVTHGSSEAEGKSKKGQNGEERTWSKPKAGSRS